MGPGGSNPSPTALDSLPLSVQAERGFPISDRCSILPVWRLACQPPLITSIRMTTKPT